MLILSAGADGHEIAADHLVMRSTGRLSAIDKYSRVEAEIVRRQHFASQQTVDSGLAAQLMPDLKPPLHMPAHRPRQSPRHQDGEGICRAAGIDAAAPIFAEPRNEPAVQFHMSCQHHQKSAVLSSPPGAMVSLFRL